MAHGTPSDISAREFAELGANNIAYVKPVRIDNGIQFMLLAGDGRELGVAPNYQTAIVAALENDFEPVSVH